MIKQATRQLIMKMNGQRKRSWKKRSQSCVDEGYCRESKAYCVQAKMRPKHCRRMTYCNSLTKQLVQSVQSLTTSTCGKGHYVPCAKATTTWPMLICSALIGSGNDRWQSQVHCWRKLRPSSPLSSDQSPQQ